MSEWKPFDYVVVEKLSEKETRKPEILTAGRLMAHDAADAKIRIYRLEVMKANEPETVEVSVNCPF